MEKKGSLDESDQEQKLSRWNVGGQSFLVDRALLSMNQPNLLQSILESKVPSIKTAAGEHFLQGDPQCFGWLLAWLRGNRQFITGLDRAERMMLKGEADYLGFQTLVEDLRWSLNEQTAEELDPSRVSMWQMVGSLVGDIVPGFLLSADHPFVRALDGHQDEGKTLSRHEFCQKMFHELQQQPSVRHWLKWEVPPSVRQANEKKAMEREFDRVFQMVTEAATEHKHPVPSRQVLLDMQAKEPEGGSPPLSTTHETKLKELVKGLFEVKQIEVKAAMTEEEILITQLQKSNEVLQNACQYLSVWRKSNRSVPQQKPPPATPQSWSACLMEWCRSVGAHLMAARAAPSAVAAADPDVVMEPRVTVQSRPLMHPQLANVHRVLQQQQQQQRQNQQQQQQRFYTPSPTFVPPPAPQQQPPFAPFYPTLVPGSVPFYEGKGVRVRNSIDTPARRAPVAPSGPGPAAMAVSPSPDTTAAPFSLFAPSGSPFDTTFPLSSHRSTPP